MDPIELIGAGGASSVTLAFLVYLLRQLDRRSEAGKVAREEGAANFASQIKALNATIQRQQEIQGQTLEAMRDILKEVRGIVQTIHVNINQRFAIEEDRRRRGGEK